MDFITQGSSILTLSSLILYLWIFYLSKNPKNRNSRNILLLLFVIFPFWAGDFYHTLFDFPRLQKGVAGHYEEVYVWIIQNVPNYYIFRFVVWGGGLLLLNYTFKLLKSNKNLFWQSFIICGLIWYSYARVSLAMAMIYCGVAILYASDRKTIRDFILGYILIFGAFFFHKSAIFGIGIVCAAIYLKNVRLQILLIFLFVFALCFIISKNIFSEFLALDVAGYENLGKSIQSAQQYLATKDDATRGIAAIILKFCEVTPYLLTSYMILRNLSTTKHNVPTIYKIMMLITILISTSYIVLSFNLGVNTETLAGRFLRFGFIPMSIVLVYFRINNFYPKYTKLIFNVALVSAVGHLTYAIYNTFF